MKYKCLCIAVALTFSALGNEVLFFEGFNGSFGSEWSIRNNDPNFYSLSASGLNLRCNSGDLFQSSNDYKNLFLIDNPAANDFVITLKAQWIVPPSNNWWAQITLVAYDDDDNYTRLGNVRFKNRMALESLTEEGAVQTDLQYSRKNFGAAPFWLQMRKEGTSYSAWSSVDGQNFTQAHPAVTYDNDSPSQLGFVAMADPTVTSTVFIDSFSVVPEPMTASMILLIYPIMVIRRHLMGGRRGSGRLYLHINKLLRSLYMKPAYRVSVQDKWCE